MASTTASSSDPNTGFSGFYAALSFGRVDGTISAPPLNGGLDGGHGFSLIGGYNWQVGALVYGGEVRVLQLNGTDWGAGGGVEPYDALLDLRGRAGYNRGDLFVYGALGVSWGSTAPSVVSPSSTDGLTFGIGVEYNVSDRVFLGADLSRRDLSGTSGFEADIDTFSVRGGLRF